MDMVTEGILQNPKWGAYARGETSIPQEELVWGNEANYFFYLGDYQKAREVSYAFSKYAEQEFANAFLQSLVVSTLFNAGLYRSLAQRQSEADKLWQDLIVFVENLSKNDILKKRKANYWIYEAYALAKLGRYEEVLEPALKGFDGLKKGKGIHKAPHNNTIEYGLVNVLETLVTFQKEPIPENKQKSQKALMDYKKENVRYGRLGYGVIFDLQISYPDVFIPVLPGSDPEQD